VPRPSMGPTESGLAVRALGASHQPRTAPPTASPIVRARNAGSEVVDVLCSKKASARAGRSNAVVSSRRTRHIAQQRWGTPYLRGLLGPVERKSVEPLRSREGKPGLFVGSRLSLTRKHELPRRSSRRRSRLPFAHGLRSPASFVAGDPLGGRGFRRDLHEAQRACTMHADENVHCERPPQEPRRKTRRGAALASFLCHIQR
jgi:hypothetical protein